MRWAVAALLLVNLIYFGWELDRDTRMQVRNSATTFRDTSSASRLSLIRELEDPPASRSSGENIDTIQPDDGTSNLEEELLRQLPEAGSIGLAADVTGAYCFTYGPLPERSQAEGLNDWFRSRNITTRLRNAEQDGQAYFWVYLTPGGTRQQALETLQNLEQQGVRDYRLIRRGRLENAISLGLFPNQSAVNERLGDLESKGFRPVVVPYTNVTRVYWLDVRIGLSESAMQDLINGYPARFNSVPVNCGQIDINASAP